MPNLFILYRFSVRVRAVEAKVGRVKPTSQVCEASVASQITTKGFSLVGLGAVHYIEIITNKET